ncbi:MAG: hypothetical protein O2983_09575 [Planctomycetota bacterium]|jgi:hypothetical protein|nr:hypothetical protein [Planctomycetota bacterium]MDA0921423.1 hypothetical protein [Planctomycetota bacterium]MDA1159847.1 hypothetical protein [Planctomycetota bacterium]
MHILGKILLGLTLILAGVAIWSTSQTLQVRNEWMKSVATKRDAYEKSIPDVGRTEKELFDTRSQYDLLMQLWAPMIGANVAITPNGNDGIVMNGIGPASGIRMGQVIHVFGPAQNGGSNYVGPFKVTVVEAGRSAAVAAWPLRASETADWNRTFIFGNDCRVYGSVPTNAPETLLRYSQVLLAKDELLAAKTDLRDTRAREVEIANEHLNYRDIELHGDPSLAGDRGVLPDHMIDGQVKAIEILDEKRNVTQLEVAEIRHNLKVMFDEVQALRDRNRQLVASLPSNEESTAPAASGVGE